MRGVQGRFVRFPADLRQLLFTLTRIFAQTEPISTLSERITKLQAQLTRSIAS